ncbi:unnamed protein product [Ranitomeya imitator]|uniref:Chromo domain-containing protein n=1 Tax=Ranitomeya imitator TaxID=111125 RepID=A0ABN9KQ35_9NEOB|nr:unnamed protein product [Ranitomeya imitator]
MADYALRILKRDPRFIKMMTDDDYWLACLLDPHYKGKLQNIMPHENLEQILATKQATLVDRLIQAFPAHSAACCLGDRPPLLNSRTCTILTNYFQLNLGGQYRSVICQFAQHSDRSPICLRALQLYQVPALSRHLVRHLPPCRTQIRGYLGSGTCCREEESCESDPGPDEERSEHNVDPRSQTVTPVGGDNEEDDETEIPDWTENLTFRSGQKRLALKTTGQQFAGGHPTQTPSKHGSQPRSLRCGQVKKPFPPSNDKAKKLNFHHLLLATEMLPFRLHVVRLHGIPENIVSDRGSQFVSRFWRAFCGRMGIDLSFSSAFHPQTNGQTERTNQTLETYLRCFVSADQDDWVSFLPLAEFALNNRASSATLVSPFFCNSGFHPRFSSGQVESSDCPGVDSVVDRLQQIWTQVVDNLTLSQEKAQLFANRRRRVGPRLRVGDLVWLSSLLVEGELEYVVEKILDSRVSRRKLQYLVKWKGYAQEDNSWVFASDVHAPDLVRAFHLCYSLLLEALRRKGCTAVPLVRHEHDRRLVWIMGHSFVFWAAERAAVRPDGRQLGFSRDVATLRWIGKRGMTWSQFLPDFHRFVRWDQVPQILVIHLGGNDLGKRPCRELIKDIKFDVLRLWAMFPKVLVVWSDIVPRKIWRGARSPEGVNRARIKVNKAVSRFMARNGAVVVRHINLESGTGGYWRLEGVHLNAVGTDMWCLAIQEGIETALKVWRDING